MSRGTCSRNERLWNGLFWREAAIALDLTPQLEQLSAFRRMIGGNIADLRRVGKSGSGLPTRTADSTLSVAHRLDDCSIRSSGRVTFFPTAPQRNRNELGEMTVNKTWRNTCRSEKNQQLRRYSLRSGRTVPNSSLHSPRAEPRCSIICHARIRVFSKMLGGQEGEQNCARSRTDRDHVDQVSRGHQYHW
jgi:hypothetical protein